MSQLQFDLLEGRKRRDEGTARVTDHNASWHDEAMIALGKFVGTGRIMTGEEMRAEIVGQVGAPKHPNAWGALINHAVKAQLIRDTGATTQAKDKKSHACRVPVWRFY